LYGAKQHVTNPWRNGSLTDQTNFAKQNPELVAFYKREAEQVDLPWSEKGSQKCDATKMALPLRLTLALRRGRQETTLASPTDVRCRPSPVVGG